ncbi:hypothetical protein HAX54_038000, partial [Datura stramonium]|nr:hypothetical protein [Datura stramonium]
TGLHDESLGDPTTRDVARAQEFLFIVFFFPIYNSKIHNYNQSLSKGTRMTDVMTRGVTQCVVPGPWSFSFYSFVDGSLDDSVWFPNDSLSDPSSPYSLSLNFDPVFTTRAKRVVKSGDDSFCGFLHKS